MPPKSHFSPPPTQGGAHPKNVWEECDDCEYFWNDAFETYYDPVKKFYFDFATEKWGTQITAKHWDKLNALLKKTSTTTTSSSSASSSSSPTSASQLSPCQKCKQLEEEKKKLEAQLKIERQQSATEKQKSQALLQSEKKKLEDKLDCKDMQISKMKQEQEGEKQQHAHLLNKQAERLRELTNDKMKLEADLKAAKASSSGGGGGGGTEVALARAEEHNKALEILLAESKSREEELRKEKSELSAKNEKLLAKLLA